MTAPSPPAPSPPAATQPATSPAPTPLPPRRGPQPGCGPRGLKGLKDAHCRSDCALPPRTPQETPVPADRIGPSVTKPESFVLRREVVSHGAGHVVWAETDQPGLQRWWWEMISRDWWGAGPGGAGEGAAGCGTSTTGHASRLLRNYRAVPTTVPRSSTAPAPARPGEAPVESRPAGLHSTQSLSLYEARSLLPVPPLTPSLLLAPGDRLFSSRS